MLLQIFNLEPVDLGSNGQELADHIVNKLDTDGILFESKNDFNEGAYIHEACQELNWVSTPQVGGFEVEWVYPIKIDGASTSVTENEMEKIKSDLGISDEEWVQLQSGDLCKLIEKKSEGHYSFS